MVVNLSGERLMLPRENHIRLNVTPTSMQANSSSLHVKVKNFTELLLSCTFLAVKLTKALTICLLKGSLIPLTRLFNEHFRPVTADLKILEPVTVTKPAKQPEPPQRALIRYLLGTIGLTIGVAAIIYFVKNFVAYGNGNTDFNYHQPLPPSPMPAPFLIKPPISDDTPRTWLPQALGSGLFLVGLAVYCIRNFSNVSDPQTVMKEMSPEDVINKAMNCLKNISCTKDDLLKAANILWEKGSVQKCIGDESNFCKTVMSSAIPILANTYPAWGASRFAAECVNRKEEVCEQIIDHYIQDLSNALTSPYLPELGIEPCLAVHHGLCSLAYDCIANTREMRQSTLTYLATVPPLILANPCHFESIIDKNRLSTHALRIIYSAIRRADVTTDAVFENVTSIVNHVKTLLNNSCREATGSLDACWWAIADVKYLLIEPCEMSETSICKDIAGEFQKEISDGHAYIWRVGSVWNKLNSLWL